MDMTVDESMLDTGLPDEEAQRQEYEQKQGDLLSAIEERESSSYGADMDPSSIERATAINYYLGEPFGNEIEGRSQVVSRDVSDTIEWIKPSLMKIFTGGDQIAKFDPTGEEDVEGAKQESDYVDFVIQRKNPWFMIAYEWFTDALLTRNAYALAYWDKWEEPVLERYQGLTDDQLALIAQDQAVEITAHNAYPVQGIPPSQIAMQMAQMTGMPPQAILHDCEVRRKKEYGQTKIAVLPPERCLIAVENRSVSVREAAFFEYWEHKTLSELRADGFDVDDDISDAGGTIAESTTIDQARDLTGGTVILGEQTTRVDPAMRRVKVRMIWIRNDFNDDGISEHRYCVVVGNTFLANQECESIPVACIVPTPLPHRHIGLSIHDAIGDLQLIKSAMLRQVVDNTYLANNGRTAVDKNRVNLDDMLVSRPGGVVRTDGPPMECLMPFTHPQTAAQGIQVLTYLDSIRQYRTGTQQPFVGPDSISQDMLPGTVDQLTSAASQRVELIARVLGEGVKELVQIVHQVTLQNATVQDKVQLRGKWVTVDPRQWKKRSDMTLSVGMGVGNQRAHVASLNVMISLAKQAIPFGLTNLSKIYNMLAELTKAMGFAAPERFWVEPPEGAQIQQPPMPQIEVAKINAQADLLVQEMKNNMTQSITTLKEEAAAAKTFFTEQQENNRQSQEQFVRMISEATERMQEMRLESARQPASNTVQIAGLDGVSDTMKKSIEAAQSAAEHAKKAGETVSKMHDVAIKLDEKLAKKTKRTVKSSSGKTYTIEDQ